MGYVSREEYLKELREKSKKLILKIINVFDDYDGDFTKIGESINKSKQSVSRILNSELFLEMVENGEIDQEKFKKIKDKINKNKIKGNKKGGNTFKNKYDVEFDESHRIIGHIRKS